MLGNHNALLLYSFASQQEAGTLVPIKITVWYCIYIKSRKYVEGICASLFS